MQTYFPAKTLDRTFSVLHDEQTIYVDFHRSHPDTLLMQASSEAVTVYMAAKFMLCSHGTSHIHLFYYLGLCGFLICFSYAENLAAKSWASSESFSIWL